ncbi:hypothetical protein [Candidatus Poriferisodalis sp.]|uniref:hypothetical protein n=1 Tax=Candidatus Poriferisodalis sp. TaxID=3101277 RepID=UPI003B018712
MIPASIPFPLFLASLALMTTFCVVCQTRTLRRCRRFLQETRAEAKSGLRQLEQRLEECEQRADAAIARMQAEIDAYGVWSDANDRFFHHGLVAVSHLLGARAMPARRACASERRVTQERRVTETAWRPKATPAEHSTADRSAAMQVRRRTCP